MVGYNNSLYIKPQDIIPYYNRIISEYKLHKVKNSCDYQKVGKNSNSLTKCLFKLNLYNHFCHKK